MRRAALLAARGVPRGAPALRCVRVCASPSARGLSSASAVSAAAAPPPLLPPAAAAALATPHAAPLAASAAEGADAAASASSSSFFGPVDAGVAFIEALHAATGLPWCVALPPREERVMMRCAVLACLA
jgi:hypothetical protein